MHRHQSLKTMSRYHGKPGGRHRIWYLIPVACAFCLIISRDFTFTSVAVPSATAAGPPSADRCSGRYIYVHDLPTRFNSDILRDCATLSPWTDMCRFTSNAGLGPALDDPGWYATNQFALEVIFHNRMKQYECLTPNSSLAATVFVPFYAGLDVARYLWGNKYNTSVRDSAALDLVRWLTSRPEWAAMGGKDHFFVAGRITWDFRRLTDEVGDWGNRLLLLPEAKNMTALVIESSPWNSNDVAIPYPTYFHPASDGEVLSWEQRMRETERPWLFSFAGAPRPNQTGSIRDLIIDQCRVSQRCKLLECNSGASSCHSPASVMRMFQRSHFCLQPQGDSYTRRSAFDAMVAGCVPVFFHPGSAYVQYRWHLPGDYTRYSVFVSEDEVRQGTARVEDVLAGFGEERVRAMREEVIGMIPRLVYGDPRSRMGMVRGDAFDVAVEGVIERVRERREGVSPVFAEENSWKYGLVGREREGEHEWDHFFGKERVTQSCMTNTTNNRS